MVIIGILGVGNVGNMPELVSVVGCFKKHGVANLPLLLTAVTLQPFPHLCICMEHELAQSEAATDSPTNAMHEDEK
jgi:hypothetical protein